MPWSILFTGISLALEVSTRVPSFLLRVKNLTSLSSSSCLETSMIAPTRSLMPLRLMILSDMAWRDMISSFLSSSWPTRLSMSLCRWRVSENLLFSSSRDFSRVTLFMSSSICFTLKGLDMKSEAPYFMASMAISSDA